MTGRSFQINPCYSLRPKKEESYTVMLMLGLVSQCFSSLSPHLDWTNFHWHTVARVQTRHKQQVTDDGRSLPVKRSHRKFLLPKRTGFLRSPLSMRCGSPPRYRPESRSDTTVTNAAHTLEKRVDVTSTDSWFSTLTQLRTKNDLKYVCESHKTAVYGGVGGEVSQGVASAPTPRTILEG